MKELKYDIAKETFCIYCQKQFASVKNFRRHVLTQHAHTYAESSLIQRLQELEREGSK